MSNLCSKICPCFCRKPEPEPEPERKPVDTRVSYPDLLKSFFKPSVAEVNKNEQESMVEPLIEEKSDS
eukprot:CAMPEP_0195517162 /NCGR_PEP_ID=MMETSP0794_2-20130614/10117_1 /TAXON_ID=515487 /ORGANISM="Stephanopyxis turris, Strain CCMP 815" /LENGTH=67 /DNA_ID=CAMNT_0040645927 /DNA_START=240 /DNA_END=443 /DNA_ORIENTATION=+